MKSTITLTPVAVPLRERTWVDVNPGSYDHECHVMSKAMIRLLQHDQNIPRDTDGAVKYKDIVQEFNKKKRKKIDDANRDLTPNPILTLKPCHVIQPSGSTPKPTSSPTLCSVWEKWEMILLRPGRAKLNGIRKNNHFKDMNRIDSMPTEIEWKHFPRNQNVGPPREDSKSNQRPTVWTWALQRQAHLHVNVQRHWMGAKGSKESCEYNSQTVANYARIFPRGHWSFLGPISEEKWCGTYTDKPNGSWDQTAQKMMANFSRYCYPIFRASSAFERGNYKAN